jgi:hypothetical protein
VNKSDATISAMRHNELMSHAGERKPGAYVVTQGGKVKHMGSTPTHYVIANTAAKRKSNGHIKF